MTRNLFTDGYCGCMTAAVFRLLAEYAPNGYNTTADGRYQWYTV